MSVLTRLVRLEKKARVGKFSLPERPPFALTPIPSLYFFHPEDTEHVGPVYPAHEETVFDMAPWPPVDLASCIAFETIKEITL